MSAWRDIGFFLTGILVVSGFALPIVLYHADIIRAVVPLVLSILGGVIVYSSILLFFHFFLHSKDEGVDSF